MGGDTPGNGASQPGTSTESGTGTESPAAADLDDVETALALSGSAARAKALGAAVSETSRLVEVKFGTVATDMVRDGDVVTAGSPISWSPDEITEGRIVATTTSGDPCEATWQDAAADPGWCKLDWVVADPVRRTRPRRPTCWT